MSEPNDIIDTELRFEAPNYTQIPNQLLGSWKKGEFIPGLLADMSEAPLKVALVLCRLTYGFHRESARVSLSWLETATGLSRQGVINGIAYLTEHGILEKKRTKAGNVFCLRGRDIAGQSEPEAANKGDTDTSGQSEPEVVNEVDQPVNEVDQVVNEVDRIKKSSSKERNERKPPPPPAEDAGPAIADSSAASRPKRRNSAWSYLARYIEQQMGSRLSVCDLKKLATGYTEQLPDGSTKKHPSPNILWETEPLYQEFVRERIEFWRGTSGSLAERRHKLVNALGSYAGNYYSWLEWLARKLSDSPSRPSDRGDSASRPEFIEPEFPEIDDEKIAELVRRLQFEQERRGLVWSKDVVVESDPTALTAPTA